MRYTIEHEVPGRLRLSFDGCVRDENADALVRAISASPSAEKVTLYPRIGGVAISYGGSAQEREAILLHVAALDLEDLERARGEYGGLAVSHAHNLLMDIAVLVGEYFLKRIFLPRPIALLCSLWYYRRFLSAALRSLGRARLDVPVLDAAAITISFVKGDPKTAGETMFLLNLGETIEEYTRARSESELIYSLLDIPEQANLIVPQGSGKDSGEAVRDAVREEEKVVPITSLVEGDLIVVRTGMSICVDGVVERGCAMVNQATLTGEPLAVERTVGDDVFAGTAVEEGEIFIRVKANTSDSKLRSIVSLVEQSEACKSESQSRMEALADRIVPWNFLLAGIVALTTRNLVKTSAALMVDYSCALKLTSSIAVLSAMSQSAKAGFTVKGSKHFETMAQADTIVFDKTGTLTAASPRVASVLAMEGWNSREVLRFSACLEEHFPHPVARAVVRAAAEKNLSHRERHAKVEYIVAHGIASSLEGKQVVIGSEHFIVEDAGVKIDDATREKIARETEGLSPLYLAVDGELVGVLGIDDPIKNGVSEAIADLRALGFKRVIMLTGDNERTAARIAEAAGVTEFHANLLPEDKHAFVERLREEGHKVVMVGDGVNDSPALSAADIGIAMGQGTAIAREVADVTLVSDDLSAIVDFRRLSSALSDRMDSSFAAVMSVNSLLLALGIAGVITPQTSSLFHNGATIVMSMRSATSYQLEPPR